MNELLNPIANSIDSVTILVNARSLALTCDTSTVSAIDLNLPRIYEIVSDISKVSVIILLRVLSLTLTCATWTVSSITLRSNLSLALTCDMLNDSLIILESPRRLTVS